MFNSTLNWCWTRSRTGNNIISFQVRTVASCQLRMTSNGPSLQDTQEVQAVNGLKKIKKKNTTAPPPLYSFASQDTEQQNRGEPVCSVCVCHYISISFLISPREQNFWFTGWCTVRLTSASVPKTQWRKCIREKDQQLLLKYVKKEWRDCSWQECNEQFVLCWNCFVKTCESDSLRKINTRSGKRTTVPLRSLIRMLPSNNAE